MQERGELEVTALLGRQIEPLGDLEREADDALRMLAGVVIVGSNDLPEHDRRAAVGAVQLEQSLETAPALLCEQRHDPEQRNENECDGRSVVHVLGDDETDAAERGVDAVDPCLPQLC